MYQNPPNYMDHPWKLGPVCAGEAEMNFNFTHGRCRYTDPDCAKLAVKAGCKDHELGGIIKRKMKTRRKKGKKKRKSRSKRRKTRR